MDLNTWLVQTENRYQIVYTNGKTVYDGVLIAKAGDMVYQFDPGYVKNDLFYTKKISGFKISEDEKKFDYILIDQKDRLEVVNSERVVIIGPLVDWIISWLFCNFIIDFKSNLD